MKTIRFKQDYIYSRSGDVIEEGDGVAEILIQRGIAEEVTDETVDQTTEEVPTTVRVTPPPITTRRLPGPQSRR